MQRASNRPLFGTVKEKNDMELTINGQVYQFNFGMGFMREMNKKVTMPVDGVKDAKKNIGLRYAGRIMDGDESLEDLLLVANKGAESEQLQKFWMNILMIRIPISISSSKIRWVS